jgi:hypothetical protein
MRASGALMEPIVGRVLIMSVFASRWKYRLHHADKAGCILYPLLLPEGADGESLFASLFRSPEIRLNR